PPVAQITLTSQSNFSLVPYPHRQSLRERKLVRPGRAGREANKMRNSLIHRVPKRARMAAGVGGAIGAALLVAACSSGGSSTRAASSPAASSAGSSSPAASGSGSTVITTATSGANTFLTEANGQAVYLWAKDTGGMSACTGACAGAW